MARVKRAVASKKHRKQVLERAKGYYGNKSRSVRAANERTSPTSTTAKVIQPSSTTIKTGLELGVRCFSHPRYTGAPVQLCVHLGMGLGRSRHQLRGHRCIEVAQGLPSRSAVGNALGALAGQGRQRRQIEQQPGPLIIARIGRVGHFRGE